MLYVISGVHMPDWLTVPYVTHLIKNGKNNEF